MPPNFFGQKFLGVVVYTLESIGLTVWAKYLGEVVVSIVEPFGLTVYATFFGQLFFGGGGWGWHIQSNQLV